MGVFLGICLVAMVFVVCEKLVGSCLYVSSDGVDGEASCSLSRVPAGEAATKGLPLFLAGIGLPLTLASPFGGFLCLLVAALLWGIGKTTGIRTWPVNG
ncbi:hypothetical protein [Desulfonatronum thiodismutans]|uniref:hypothetical protein n=1 Tax=Desulfonatronum thiodismutans TaxID=159290 RepID=UPI0004ABE72E|nr:hypothetical protein [Desulfonatronum thiodismutans]